MSEFEKGSNKAALKRALCYVPLVAIIFSIVEKWNKELELDIRYWIMLFVWYFIISIIAGILWLGALVFLVYLAWSWYLWFKAYSNEKIQIDILDQAYDAIMGKAKKSDKNDKEF